MSNRRRTTRAFRPAAAPGTLYKVPDDEAKEPGVTKEIRGTRRMRRMLRPTTTLVRKRVSQGTLGIENRLPEA